MVKFCADQGEAQFVAEIHNKLSGKAPADMEITEADRELIIEAFEVIRQEKRASTSNLQRRMRLGYNRAAYVIDYLEKVGVLAPGDGAKPRKSSWILRPTSSILNSDSRAKRDLPM